MDAVVLVVAVAMALPKMSGGGNDSAGSCRSSSSSSSVVILVVVVIVVGAAFPVVDVRKEKALLPVRSSTFGGSNSFSLSSAVSCKKENPEVAAPLIVVVVSVGGGVD